MSLLREAVAVGGAAETAGTHGRGGFGEWRALDRRRCGAPPPLLQTERMIVMMRRAVLAVRTGRAGIFALLCFAEGTPLGLRRPRE